AETRDPGICPVCPGGEQPTKRGIQRQASLGVVPAPLADRTGFQTAQVARRVGPLGQTRRAKCAQLALRQTAGGAAYPETHPPGPRYFPLGIPSGASMAWRS